MKKLIFLVVICGAVFLAGCSQQGDVYVPQGSNSQSVIYEENILTAETDTEARARDIAEKCGIALEKWENGHALFHTEENLDTVIQRAEEQGIFVLKKSEKIDYYG